EIILAAELSRLYSKDQILEWYLNTSTANKGSNISKLSIISISL
ncbi:MAG: hypothetical protein D6822_00865, partial [Cyanobacteria bacterium J149]